MRPHCGPGDGERVRRLSGQRTCRNKTYERIGELNDEEVAKLLHYSPKTIYEKAAKGETPSVPISRRERLFNHEIIAY
jgi:predicted DNA-binding transcriptional regulator AlpA